MQDGTVQRMIMVFPDGRCQDDCNSGTFFANQRGRHLPGRNYEDSFVQELIPHIDENFRTRAPQEFPVR